MPRKNSSRRILTLPELRRRAALKMAQRAEQEIVPLREQMHKQQLALMALLRKETGERKKILRAPVLLPSLEVFFYSVAEYNKTQQIIDAAKPQKTKPTLTPCMSYSDRLTKRLMRQKAKSEEDYLCAGISLFYNPQLALLLQKTLFGGMQLNPRQTAICTLIENTLLARMNWKQLREVYTSGDPHKVYMANGVPLKIFAPNKRQAAREFFLKFLRHNRVFLTKLPPQEQQRMLRMLRAAE